MLVYVEGELEIRVFNDADTGVIKRDREVAVHVSGMHELIPDWLMICLTLFL